MKLYDNDAYRDEFMSGVYALLGSDPTCDRANQVIDLFDHAPAVEATTAAQTDDPLTVDNLLEMDGEPVWVCKPSGANGVWGLVDREYQMIRLHGGGLAVWENNGKTWLAYRRKPEEEVT